MNNVSRHTPEEACSPQLFLRRLLQTQFALGSDHVQRTLALIFAVACSGAGEDCGRDELDYIFASNYNRDPTTEYTLLEAISPTAKSYPKQVHEAAELALTDQSCITFFAVLSALHRIGSACQLTFPHPIQIEQSGAAKMNSIFVADMEAQRWIDLNMAIASEHTFDGTFLEKIQTTRRKSYNSMDDDAERSIDVTSSQGAKNKTKPSSASTLHELRQHASSMHKSNPRGRYVRPTYPKTQSPKTSVPVSTKSNDPANWTRERSMSTDSNSALRHATKPAKSITEKPSEDSDHITDRLPTLFTKFSCTPTKSIGFARAAYLIDVNALSILKWANTLQDPVVREILYDPKIEGFPPPSAAGINTLALVALARSCVRQIT